MKILSTTLLVIILSVILMTNVLAATADITIKTLPNKRLFIQYLKSGEVYTQVKDSTIKNTGNGDILISDSFSIDLIDLKMVLRDDSGDIISDRIEDVKTKEPVFISFVPGSIGIIEKKIEPKNETNNTSINSSIPPVNNNPAENISTISQNQTNVSRFAITGFVVSIKDFSSSINSKIPWKIVIYFITGIAALVIVIFIFIFYKKKLRKKQFNSFDSRIHLGSDHVFSNHSSGYGEEKALRSAEEKIRLAQEEINVIKQKKEKIKEVERRMEQDKRELDRLRHGRF